jgi:predicted nucleic acid-binding protein
MGMSYIFDTNVVIYFLGKIMLTDTALIRLDGFCKLGQHLSIITKLEFLGYNFERDLNESSTKKFVSNSLIYQITPDIETETISLRKTAKIKLPDAIIAATAISNNFTLISANTKDFAPIKHLRLINPFDL